MSSDKVVSVDDIDKYTQSLRMQIGDMCVFIKSLENQIKTCQKFVEKINYDLNTVIRDEIALACREERASVRELVSKSRKIESELKKQNAMLRHELRLTKQSKKIIEFLKEEKNDGSL